MAIFGSSAGGNLTLALCQRLRDAGLEFHTHLMFFSDHGDMHGSQGQMAKEQPFDESILVPFILRYPAALGRAGRVFVDHVGADIWIGGDVVACIEGRVAL